MCHHSAWNEDVPVPHPKFFPRKLACFFPESPIFGHFIHLATYRTSNGALGWCFFHQTNSMPTKSIFHTETSILIKLNIPMQPAANK
jgi:hypothetical protein